MKSDQLEELAAVYFNAVLACAPHRPFIIDKLPANFQSVGLISMLAPDAKIINMRRHPLDVGFSIYKNFFNENEPYFCALDEIGEYRRFYEDIMAHWRAVLPGFVHEVRYEDLVARPKEIVSEALAFCGLEWQDACLEYHKARRHVQTLSETQVRQKLSSARVGAATAYAERLKPLTSALGGSIEAYENC